LGVVELFQGFFEVAGEARGVRPRTANAGVSSAERSMMRTRHGLGMFGADAVLVLIEAEGDQIVLERSNTVEPPRGVGEGLERVDFRGCRQA